MKTRPRDLFLTVRTEGGLLPADLLARIAEGDAAVEGLAPEAYHLSGERLTEAVSRAWTRVTAAWAAFRAATARLAETDLGASPTRERWLLVLFDVLGYGRLPAARGLEIDGKAYPISHLWQRTPIHLVGFRVGLDRPTPGVAGAARASPHSLLQEFLNRSAGHQWGLVSNGLRLRILRDSASLTRQAYVEFDLEAMMEGEVYSDFVLLWLLAHESRVGVEDGRPEECWLERWTQAARDEGIRALDGLRAGVEEAIQALGRGFLAHRANDALRERLRSGALSTQDYYRELLRLVYRLLFLFVAEDRRLLLDLGADPAARERYERYYSTGRFRRLAERRRGTKHADLYRGLRVVMEKLGSDAGCPALALPALGSFLWSPAAIPDLAAADLANVSLLEAVRALAFTEEAGVRRATDYKNLGSEELGSVYESLLELHPDVNAGAATFDLATAGGHERKTTGSYYTPSSLIHCLLDSALDPVLDAAARRSDPERAILDLKVCDPACGSGHFLIAAAHRIARRLAAVRTGDAEPSPEATRAALRDVIGHSIYGVDQNPMAVELCKVSLWMEALEPGKPLSFLEHRILCGNSLLGATPALLEAGIPDDAWKPIEGDDKEVAARLKRQNRDERHGQADLFTSLAAEAGAAYSTLAGAIASLDAISDDSIAAIHRKEASHRQLAESDEYRKARLAADAWCAAFVWKKVPGAPPAITHDVFLRLRKAPGAVHPAVLAEIHRLAEQYGFFHWHLAFPDVFRIPADGEPENPTAGWSGGFDVLLGNPPWDTLSPDAKEFFSAYDPEIRFHDKAGQERIVTRLLGDPALALAWEESCRLLYAQVHFFKESGRYDLFAPGNLGKGDFNIYRMFIETGMQLVRPGGVLAQVVPENLYNGANAMAIRRALFDHFEWTRLFGFENAREVWFSDIDTRTKFCLYAARKGGRTETIHAVFNISSSAELNAARTSALRLPIRLIQEFSPEALAIMELSSQRDIDIATEMYALWPKFGDATAGPPHRHYMREIDMGTDRELFTEDPAGLPLYEGRMVDAFDHRAKAYRSGRGRAADWPELPFGDPEKAIRPQWHVPMSSLPGKLGDRTQRYRIGFCDVASPTNERTLVAALIPPGTVCGDKVPTIAFEPGHEWSYMVWLALANSFVMDFLVRKKVSLKMSYTVLDSLPFPRLPPVHAQARRLVELAARLTCTGPEMRGYWDLLARDGWLPAIGPADPLPGLIDQTQRRQARAELDAVVARDLFGLSRAELEHILDTFPIVRRRDEEELDEFRTRALILERFDATEPPLSGSALQAAACRR